jgi:glucose-1-phosphate thymidylyltransferase
MSLKGLVVVPPSTSPGVTTDGPSLQRIANRPIVCHALEALIAAGITAVAIVGPAEAMADVRKCLDADADAASGVEIVYLTQPGRTDLLGALQAAAPFVGDDPVVTHFADGLLGQELALVTEKLTGDVPDLLLLLYRSVDSRETLGPTTQTLLGITELNGSRSRLALAGVCLFGAGALRRAAEAARDQGLEVDLGPEVDLVAIAELLAGQGRVLEAAFVRTWRRYRGDPLDLLELNRLVLDQQAPQGEPLDCGDNRIEGRVIIDPSAEVTASIILGPCIIGARARVASSYIGPYTSIGAGAEIEGAEIVRSIVSEGVRIMHVRGRIEGSTIGRGASIFRDFSLPRAMRLHVGEDVEVALD